MAQCSIMYGVPIYAPHYEEYYDKPPTLYERWVKPPVEFAARGTSMAAGILSGLALVGTVGAVSLHSIAGAHAVYEDLKRRRMVKKGPPANAPPSLGNISGPGVWEDLPHGSLTPSPEGSPHHRGSQPPPFYGPDERVPPIINAEVEMMHRSAARELGRATAPVGDDLPPGSIAESMFSAEQEARGRSRPASKTSVPLVPVVEDVPVGVHNEMIKLEIPKSKRSYPGYNPPTADAKAAADRAAARGMELRSNHDLATVVRTLVAEGHSPADAALFTRRGLNDRIYNRVYIPRTIFPMLQLGSNFKGRIHQIRQ